MLHEILVWGCLVFCLCGAVLGAYCYAVLRVELRLHARRAVSRAEWEGRCVEMVAEWEALRNRVLRLEQLRLENNSAGAPAAGWQPPAMDAYPAAMAQPDAPQPLAADFERRGQIIRLHGRGHTLDEIAADLQISKGEVDLLLKVQDWPDPARPPAVL